MERWLSGGQSSPFERTLATLGADGLEPAASRRLPVSRNCLARVTRLAALGRAQDPRSSCDGARAPSAIPATKAGGGFHEAPSYFAEVTAQGEASLLGMA